MVGERTASQLLGEELFLNDQWHLRVFCAECVRWRSVSLAAVLRRHAKEPDMRRIIDVVAKLQCSHCHRRPAAVRMVREAWGTKARIHDVELLRSRPPSGGVIPPDDGPG